MTHADRSCALTALVTVSDCGYGGRRVSWQIIARLTQLILGFFYFNYLYGYRRTLIAVISAQLYAVRFTTGDSYQNYSTGTAIGTLAFTFAWLLLLSNPMAECRHETHRDSLEKSPLWKRVFYALCILVGTRGVGWNYQVHTSLYTACICELLTEPTD